MCSYYRGRGRKSADMDSQQYDQKRLYNHLECLHFDVSFTFDLIYDHLRDSIHPVNVLFYDDRERDNRLRGGFQG
jgi:hypothetical protein